MGGAGRGGRGLTALAWLLATGWAHGHTGTHTGQAGWGFRGHMRLPPYDAELLYAAIIGGCSWLESLIDFLSASPSAYAR